jgi:hypothetical protein
MPQCFPFAQGRRLRITELDNCGNPVGRFVVSKGFVSVSVGSETESGTAIQPMNANGELCYQIRSVDQFLRHTLEIEFCEVDPTLFDIVTHSNPVLDYDDDEVGFQTLEGGAETGYALEVWMGVPGQDCPPAGANPVDSLGYVLFPWVMPGALGDFEIGNDSINFTVAGFTKGGSPWGAGPYDVVAQDAANVAGPLTTPITSDVHAHLQWVSVPAPDPFCGAIVLS